MRFDDCADTYDAHAAPQRAFAGRVAAFIGAGPSEAVLELGAGTGALTRHLCSRARQVIATDASAAMVTIGRKAAPEAEWRLLDAFAGHIPPSELQVSSGLLQWAERPEDVLKRWGDALLRGGRMVHAFPCEPCLAEWREVMPQSPLEWRTEAEWVDLFTRCGLRIARQERWVDRAHLASGLELVRGLHRTGVTGRIRLGPGQLRRAIREYERRFGDGPGVGATWAWMAVEANRGREG